MRFLPLALSLAVFAAPAFPQAAATANSGYKTHEGRERVAQSLNAGDRESKQRPKELIEVLGIKPGDTVVDLGTGVGYMLPYLSEAVGPKGKVLAEDIFDDFLTQAKQNAAKHSLTNVVFIKGTDRDPRLPANSADLVMALDSYHHFDYPAKMLAVIARSLHPGGRLAIIDFYKAGFRDPAHIRLDQDGVIREVEANGFELVHKQDHQPKVQYIAIFRKK
ncbi:MAG: Ubiquinone/menaquinone biosynthesis C-methyltransferase UbiE [Bryobacteraceae bacterium]|nr:Ubiquinone/menaquinone biosynthesis C-methyltransferase UbiE [Bryobacteraceae bacterium]